MIYTVRVWDEAYYEVEADTAKHAELIACDWFDERCHATQITDVKEEEE